MTLFSQAAKGLNLTAGQRAFLKMLQSLVISVLSLGLTSAIAIMTVTLNSNQPLDLIALGRLIGVAFASSLLSVGLHGLAKYISASGDAPLGTALDALASVGEQRLSQQQPLVVRYTASSSPATPQAAPTIVPAVQPVTLSPSAQDTPVIDLTTTAPRIPLINP